MKKLFLITLIILSSLFACELEDIYTFHLTYSITSLDDNPVDIEITYKVGNEYVTEQTQTPFIYEQDIELNKTDEEKFYYYLKASSFNLNNINVQIISNDKIIHNYNNIVNPLIIGGYIGFGLTPVTVNL